MRAAVFPSKRSHARKADYSRSLVSARLRTLVLTAPLLASPSLDARVIQMSLGDNASPTLRGAAGGTGNTWNDWRTLESGLKDSTGINTTVTFTAGGDGPYGDWWCDLELLASGSHVDDGVTSPLVIAGLDPHKTYDLYIARSWGNKGGNTTFHTANPMNTASPQTADNRIAGNATTWIRGTNFVFFQDLEADDSGQIDLTYGGTGTYGILNGFQLVGPIEVPTTTYQSWAADPTQGLTPAYDDGPLDDPDEDGVVNLLEFTLGGMPMVASRTILPKLTSSGGTWIFEYDRSDAARPPATQQVVEYSSDLLTWTPVIVPVISGNGVTIVDNGPTDHVQVTLPDSGGPMFARLKAAQ